MIPFIFSPDASYRLDPPVDSLLRQLPNRSMGIHDADVAIVPVTRLPDFKFNPALNDLKKPWVLVDFCEFSWNDPMDSSYLWGSNRLNCEEFQTEEWRKFDEFVVQNPPVLTFQRELLEKDKAHNLLPIEYTSYLPEQAMDSKEYFKKRQLECLFNWGRSSEYRMMLHGQIFAMSGAFGYDVVSQWDHIDKAVQESAQGRKWASIHAPHYARLDVKEVHKVTRQSKIALVARGCGVKTFRQGEICDAAVMAMQTDKLAWTFPWVDGENCIRLDIDSMRPEQYVDAIKKMNDALMNLDRLYDIYCNAMTTARLYRFESYLRNMVANIEKFL